MVSYKTSGATSVKRLHMYKQELSYHRSKILRQSMRAYFQPVHPELTKSPKIQSLDQLTRVQL